MSNRIDQLKYYMMLFLYSLRNNEVNINTLFRYIYIYDVTSDYLGNNGYINKKIIIDEDIGINNVLDMRNAINELSSSDFIDIRQNDKVYTRDELINHVDELLKVSEKIKNDLNRIMYFSEVISSYSEDVILEVFFSEPNVRDAIDRGKKDINLSNNKLKDLLIEFEMISNKKYNKDLDKYDVFISWINYILESYLKGKSK